jgi:hypothetical protein
VIALLFLLIALFGFSSGSSSSTTAVPAAPAPAPAAGEPVRQPMLTPAKGPCVKIRFYRADTPQGPVHTPCNAYNGMKP